MSKLKLDTDMINALKEDKNSKSGVVMENNNGLISEKKQKTTIDLPVTLYKELKQHILIPQDITFRDFLTQLIAQEVSKAKEEKK